MKQKTSFFNWGLSRNILKRTWVLWAAYLLLMLAVTVGSLPTVNLRRITDLFAYTVDYNYSLMSLGISVAQINVFAAVAAAMAVYSYMYSSRSCGMINALPIRRETAYITAYITGLAALIAADIISVLAVWVMSAQTGLLFTDSIWALFGFAVLSSVAFYSFASFCAVLTGNVFVLPAVYAVLGCVAFVVIATVSELLADLIYGMPSDYIYSGRSEIAYILSPMIYVLNTSLDISRVTVYDGKGESSYTGEYNIQGLDVLGVYCAIGLALVVCAVLIYRRRDMERAGDVVAVPVLMPVFKYCMTFGTAIVFALLVYHNVLTNIPKGLATAIVITVLLVIGAAIGYYAAEMLMLKTLKVFRVKCVGLIVSCVMLAVFALAAEFDLAGFESYVPAAEEVEKAELSCYGRETVLENADNLAAATNLHRDVIAAKVQNESAESYRYLTIIYTLTDGSTVRREYRISGDDAAQLGENSHANVLQAIFSTQESKTYYLGFDGKNYEVTAHDVDSAGVDGYYVLYPDGKEENGEYKNIGFELTPEQTAELYECVLLDAKDSSIGSQWFVFDEEYYNTASNLSFYINLNERVWSTNFMGTPYYYYPYLSVNLTMDAQRTMQWIAENTDITPMSLAEADPVEAEEHISELRTAATHTTNNAIGIIGGADGPTAIFVAG